MVRKFSGYRRRRYARRYNRTYSRLSNRNIYLHRSSRAQATQIAALKKKVNHVYRACRPERKTTVSNPFEQLFTNGATAVSAKSYVCPDIAQGTNSTQRIGDKVFRRDTFKLTLGYTNNASGGLHNNEVSGSFVRLIAGIWKEPKNAGSTPISTDVIKDYAQSGLGYRVSCIQPLQNEITTAHRIFYDKVIKVDLNQPLKLVKIRSPWYNARWDSDGFVVHSWLWVFVNELDYDTTFEERVELTGLCKTVFSDA
ncbi:capsid protein [Chifec virus UA13_122]|nr:capsid protein [Chifec virus UA13_122]